MSPYYELSTIDRAGMWTILGQCMTWDRARRWMDRCPTTWPVRVMDQPAGIMMVLRDDCAVRVVASTFVE